MYVHYLKRVFDFSAAALLAVLTAIVTVPVAVMLAFANGGKVFFVQPRPGYLGKPFLLLKFRTMTEDCDIAGRLLPDSQRLTRLGKFLRKTSLDELPQLVNVLKGELSLVGPRPLLMEYLPLYSPEQAQRHSVKPGITGWAQVNGRNAISWPQRFSHDLWYVDHISFVVDVKILWLTAVKVLRAKDIDSLSGVTMEKFEGNIQPSKAVRRCDLKPGGDPFLEGS
jgi:lipopolysaccharide/colanic/teichoic acid biosynthesis glycosyltransferase